MKTYSDYLNSFFPGAKVQKISVNAGFSCPNRDGTIGTGGCIYCDNTSFTPGYCFSNDGIVEQLEAGKRFFSRKYPNMKYLAYFQSFTNTFGRSLQELEEIYHAALAVDDVVGIIIGTRPDTLPEDIVDMLKRIARKTVVFVELGAETSFDTTLSLINRNHTWKQTVDAVLRLNAAGLHTGLHLIAGLPGETPEMTLKTVERACRLPIETLKIHHLQVLEGTSLKRLAEEGKIEIPHFTLEEYIDLCVKIVKIVPHHIVIERFLASSPPNKVIAPKWGLKNYEFMNLLRQKLKKVNSHE